jgi:polysaccharide chain length determinant protein (PEP-CTERM system associated)
MVSGRKYSPRYLLQLLRRRGAYAAIPFALVVALAIVVARSWPDLFYAQATITIHRQQVPEAYVRGTVIAPFADRVARASGDLKTPARMEALMEEFDLYPEARQTMPATALTAWLAQYVRVDIAGPETVAVGFGGYERTKIAPAATRLMEWFVDDMLASREVIADSTSRFLDQELESARDRLREQEQRVQRYREEHAGELPTQVGANLQILQGAYAQLQALEEAARQDRDRRNQLQDELSQMPEPSGADVAAQPDGAPAAVDAAPAENLPVPEAPPMTPLAIAERLRTARARLNDLLQVYTPEHPEVAHLRSLIRTLEDAAKASPVLAAAAPAATARPGIRRREIEREIAQLDARIAEREGPREQLRQTVDTYRARVEAVPMRESEWADLTRDYSTLEQAYTSLLAKSQESRLAASLERQPFGEELKIAQHPVEPTNPVSPNRPRILIIGLFVGLFLGVGSLAAFELFDTGLRGENEVLTTLRVPVLAMLPLAKTPQERRRERHRLAIGSAFVLLAIVAAVVWRSV